LQGILKVSTVKKLAIHVTDKEKKDALKVLTKPNNEDFKKLQEKHLGIIDLMEMYSIRLSLEKLVEVTERIVPRYYTISSSSKKHPRVVSIAISLSVTDCDSEAKMGLTSVYSNELADLDDFESCFLKIGFQKSIFRLPEANSETPVLCVSGGAGLAPFKGF